MGTNSTRRSPHVLLSTEGTYPFIMGGVSTWCEALVSGIADVQWHVLAITAGGLRRESLFEFPTNVASVTRRELWSDSRLATASPWTRRPVRTDLAAALANGLLGWDSSVNDLIEALVWCRKNPGGVRPSFRATAGWQSFLDVLSRHNSAELHFTQADAAEIYQTLLWVARAAAERTRTDPKADPIDLHLVTAAGWAGIGSVIDCELDPKPLVLAEHGVYVRESYLGSVRNSTSRQAQRWFASRLARGLARLVYDRATIVAPVTQANAAWERHLGVNDERIRPIYNGVVVPPTVRPFPAKQRIVSIGRLDPLKDIATSLRAAAIVVAARPDVQFVHYGPVPDGNDNYAAMCARLHEELRLGDRFILAGPTDDPMGTFAQSSMAFFSSISEGFPVAVLEAMACGRPVVATAVGGVPEALSGCGLTVRPGDYQGLAAGLLRLVNDPVLQRRLGERSYARVREEFGMANCLQNYRDLFVELTGLPIADPEHVVFDRNDTDLDLGPSDGDHFGDITSGELAPRPARSGIDYAE